MPVTLSKYLDAPYLSINWRTIEFQPSAIVTKFAKPEQIKISNRNNLHKFFK